jgi:hypothetical protein
VKHWQVRVTFANEGIMSFGVEADNKLVAELRAFEFIPGMRIKSMDVSPVRIKGWRKKTSPGQ